jgi:DnaJ-class molecular chaperone
MIVETECPRCHGEGWTMKKWLFQNRVHVTDSDCETCNGTGCIAVDQEDEIEDWMRD